MWLATERGIAIQTFRLSGRGARATMPGMHPLLIVVLAVGLVVGLWLLARFWRLVRRAGSNLRRRDFPAAQKRFWLTLLFVGKLLAVGGAVAAGASVPWGWHVMALGVAWAMTAVWFPAYQFDELMNGVRGGAGGLCLVGSVILLVGVGFAIFGSPAPVFGTGSLGDVITFAGFALVVGGLWSIAPGPGGIAVG